MNTKKMISFITALTLLPASGIALFPSGAAAADNTVTTVKLDPSNASPFNNGRFEGWGTSLCWWANRVGYSEKLTEQAGKLFFSEDGLGLDIARYNIGGGDDPTHNHVTRSDSKVPGVWESFEYTNGGEDVSITYDVTKDSNQLNIAKAALKANSDIYFEGFSNSPPYFMTNSGCSSGAENASDDNLKTNMYDDFAEYIAESTKLLKDEGIVFESYSPMNEPDTNYWGANSPKQEGCHYTPGTSQSNMIVETRKALDNAGLTDVIVAGMDETSIDSSVNNLDKLTDEAKSALGRIDTHTYSGSKRSQLKDKAVAMNKTLWMSEVDGGWNGFGLADRIILDMNGMMPAAWIMWDIIDVHKDSEFTDPSGNHTEAGNSVSETSSLWGVGMADHDKEEFVLTNKYYAFGQFTKYINPGDTIIASSDRTLAAYNKESGDIKIVVANSSSQDVPYEFDLSSFSNVGSNVKEIRSNNSTGADAEHWAEIEGEASINGKTLTTTAKAYTITTYIVEGSNAAALTAFSADENGMSYSYTLSNSVKNNNAYLAVYGSDGTLKYVSYNKSADSVSGDFSGCTPMLMVWDDNQNALITPVTEVISSDDTTYYGVITGADDELELNSDVQLSLNTDLDGNVEWSVSDDSVASITADGKLTTKSLGTVTVYAKIAGYTFQRTFSVPMMGTINGIGSTLKCGETANLSLEANISGTVVWSVSDDTVASITEDGVITGLTPGEVTIYAAIGEHKIEKTITVQLYTVTGTASWGNDSTRPDDNADYRKAVDGDLTTYFDGTQGGWVQYDYGAPYKLSEVKLAARSGNGFPERTIGGTIQASNDGISWTDLYKITTAIPSDVYTTISASQLSDNHAYRYYRYTNNDEMANIAEFLLSGDFSDDTPENAPTVTDIEELTDNFEGSTNIFNAAAGTLAEDGNTIYASGLERYGNVFVPVKATATASLSEPIELTGDQLFRMTFTMFAGWENNGKDNTFAIKDKDGNEIAALYITGGGYNFNQIRIGGTNVLSGTPIAQSRSNPGTNKAGANGWNASGQPYVNTVGYNKTVEITISGTGIVSISATGGMEDTIVSGTLTSPVSIGSIELSGSYNSSRERVVSYDNLDTDVITYESGTLPAPTDEPDPTEAPVLPQSGELINLSFDNGDLTSSSTYGKAEGTPSFVTEDGKQCVYFDGTRNSVITLTDANGNSLLTDQKNLTISFKVKPTTTGTSWWFFAAPNSSKQTYQKEKYLGVMTASGTLTHERYNNNGARSESATGTYTTNEWNDVMISIADGSSTVYINGNETETVASTVDISEMLGSASVAYIGLANWNDGEYATGYLDDFVIYNKPLENPLGSISLGDTSAVKSNITIPEIENVTWESSDPSVVSTDGSVTRSDDTKTVTLTAKTTADGINFTKTFKITVIGYTASLDTFTAYSEGKTIYYTTDYNSEDTEYTLDVSVTSDNVPGFEGNTSAEPSGSFNVTDNGTYKVTCSLKNGGETVRSVTKTIKVKDAIETTAYLFAHFVNTEGDANCEQIYFSVSEDGQTWTTLNNNLPILTSTVGEKGVRDPYILRGEDGKFFIIATDLSIYNRRGDSNRWSTCQTSGSKSIVIWESTDLVNWSEARLIEVADENAGCTWAPEAVYDPEKDMYMVFWASKVSDDNYSTQRVYRSYTSDFVSFTEPEIYIEDTVSNIDTTIIEHEGVYYRFTKNESQSSIIMEKCTSLSGAWTDVETYNLGSMTGYEGPAIYKLNGEDKWCLLLDYYSKSQGYKPFVTDDITKGVFTQAADFTFDGTYRHGTVLPITQAEYDALTAKY